MFELILASICTYRSIASIVLPLADLQPISFVDIAKLEKRHGELQEVRLESLFVDVSLFPSLTDSLQLYLTVSVWLFFLHQTSVFRSPCLALPHPWRR